MSVRKRSANFTRNEEQILILLVKKYIHIIECKKTNVLWNKKKFDCWRQIEREFNARIGEERRNARILRKKYGNLKKYMKIKSANKNTWKIMKPYDTPHVNSEFDDIDVEVELQNILNKRNDIKTEYERDVHIETTMQIEDDDEKNLYLIEEDRNYEYRTRNELTSTRQHEIEYVTTDTEGQTTMLIEDDDEKNLYLIEEDRNYEYHIRNELTSTRQHEIEYVTTDTEGREINYDLTIPTNKSLKCSLKGDAKLEHSESEHSLKLKLMKEKHKEEIRLMQQKAVLEMKILEEEHLIRMEILKKQLSQ